MIFTRRSILKAATLCVANFLVQKTGAAQLTGLLPSSTIIPKFKEWRKPYPTFEFGLWREADYSEFPYKTQPKIGELWGYLDGLSTEDALPMFRMGAEYFPVGLVAANVFPRHGIFIEVSTQTVSKNLRRINPRTGKINSRYAALASPADFIVIRSPIPERYAIHYDHRKARLHINGETIYQPDKYVWNSPVDHIGVSELYRKGYWGKDRPLVPTQSEPGGAIDFLMHFDAGFSNPMDFVLELGEVEYMGRKIPIPAMIFKPYDTQRNVWLD